VAPGQSGQAVAPGQSGQAVAPGHAGRPGSADQACDADTMSNSRSTRAFAGARAAAVGVLFPARGSLSMIAGPDDPPRRRWTG